VLLQRAALADALAKRYAMLDLDRKKPRAVTLDDYVKERYGAAAAEESPAPAESDAQPT
jgi:hypothetical protein